MSWFWESEAERLEREARRREAELLTGKWEGRYSYRLPITGDVINTTRIYAIQVEGKVVIVRTWNDHLRLAKGGYTYSYHIVDGEKVVGQKVTHAETRTSGETTVYFLDDLEFATAKEFVAAYEAKKKQEEVRHEADH